MELNGQTGFEYTNKSGKVFQMGVSESISESLAGMIDRINPQPILILATCGLCLYLTTNPEMRRQFSSACSRLLTSAAT